MSQTYLTHFSELTDPRQDRTKLHLLEDIVTIAVCAVICGANNWSDIEGFGRAKFDWLKNFLTLSNGIPSHDTFNRVFSHLDPKEFQDAFSCWVQTLAGKLGKQVVAIDGKTVRRSHDRSSGVNPIHMVSAWASENQLVLGQVKTNEKSNEITAIPELLNAIDLKNTIVTIDAMGCQKAIASAIREKEADYVLTLKGNHGTLYKHIDFFFSEAEIQEFEIAPFDFHETSGSGHGRSEVRRCWVTDDIAWLKDKSKWTDLKSVAMIESERHINGALTVETRYFISSLPADAALIGSAVRSHWGIENSLHWILDVAFREDENRSRKGHSAENMAVLRRIALNLLKQDPSKGSVKGKRLRAGWDNQFLQAIVFTQV